MNASSAMDVFPVGLSQRQVQIQIPTGKDERTVPFLRQLTEMLLKNNELISFIPGRTILGQDTILGKIVVHDRDRVQSDVLPIYFNHASFASLRRQLSYFSFVRVGKGRQGGVIYTNDSVVELSDILKLKRRIPASKQMTDIASAVNNGMKNAAKTNQDFGNMSPDAPVNNEINVVQSIKAGNSCIGSGRPPNSYSGVPINISPIPCYNKPNREFEARNRNKSQTDIKPIARKRERCAGSGRLKKLLYNNGIVPFIHLPAKTKGNSFTDIHVEVTACDENLTKKTKREEPPAVAVKDNLQGTSHGGRIDAALARPHAQSRMVNTTSLLGTIRDQDNFTPTLAANDSAIHALLALGCKANQMGTCSWDNIS